MPLRNFASVERDLNAGGVVILDGATGTELERRGAAMDENAWCALATATVPNLLRSVHEEYIAAGARVITANTFSTNRLMLEPAGLGHRFQELNRKAVEIALAARDRADPTVVVAGSMSHQLPIVPGSDERDAREIPAAAKAQACFQEMAELLAECGVDLIIMEMMSDPDLANRAIAAAVSTGLPVWVGFSVRSASPGNVTSYSKANLGVEEMLRSISLDGAHAAGVMHSRPDLILPAINLLKHFWRGPLMAYPDSGYFRMPHWQFVDIIPVPEYVRFARRWIAADVQIVGGCCGLGVEHIRGLAAFADSAVSGSRRH